MLRRSLRIAPYRVLALLVAVAVAVTLTFYAQRAEAVITTPFTDVFSANVNGSVVLRGNANLTCPPAAAGCTDALAGVGSPATEALNNNGYVMQNRDVDGDSGTVNSSTTQLTLPADSTVLFAGLYWSANVTAGTSGTAAPVPANRNRVKFAVPGTSAYTTLTSDETNVSGDAYQSYAEVTPLVSGAGNGTYAVADIQAGTGQDRYAGWALVVAYRNPGEPMRNLRVYDGFGVVSNGSTSVNIPVNGFQTPQSGPVTTRIGTVVYEGDLGKTGDTLQLNTVSMTDARNPVNNFFNSTVSDAAALVTTRNPAHPNLLGVDIDQFDASGLLANDATSATLTLTTGGETFYPGVVTFTTDLYAPDLTATMQPTDVDGGDLLPGDVLEYTIGVRNDGSDSSIESVLTDAVPAGTTYVPGSLRIGPTAVTDAAEDDAGDFLAGSGRGTARFRLGTGADATVGGRMAPDATTSVTFRVRVDLDTPGGYTVVNLANVAYTGEHTARKITGTSGASGVTVLQPDADLAAGLTVAPAVVQHAAAPQPVAYQLTVTNNGPQLEPAATAALTLPAGVTAGPLPAGCSAAGQVVTCAMGTLAAGTGLTRQIDAVAATAAASVSTAGATAAGTGDDQVPANDSHTVVLAVNRAPTAGADTADTTNGAPVTVPVLGNDTDPDNATLSTSVTGAPANGAAVANGNGTVTYTPDAGYAGTDTFTYQVSDGRGGTATATVTVTVANAAPVAVADHASGPAAQPVTLAVLDNDSDPNDDPLTVTAVTQPGTAGTVGAVTFTDDSVTFTPVPAFAGTATFSYTVADDDGGSTTATVTVDIANAGPDAADDVVGTPYHTDVVVDVLDGDTDPNDDPLTVTAVTQPADGSVDLAGGVVTYRAPTGFSGATTFDYTISDGAGGTDTATVTVTVGNATPFAADVPADGPYGSPVEIDVLADASDPNDDPLTIAGTTDPAHGGVAVTDGKLVYTPDPAWSGTEEFDYTISDGRGGVDTGRVTVTIANAAPVAVPDAVTAETGTALAVPVLANDSDANGDPLTVVVDTAPEHGGVTVDDGEVVYTPAPGYRGPDTFHYTISDGRGGSAGATVTVTVVNSPPVAVDDSRTTPTNTPVTVEVLDNDTDAAGDPLEVTGYTAGAQGTVTEIGPGVLRYAPDAGKWGADTFTYTIADPAGGTSTATVTVTVQNAPPTATTDLFTVRAGRSTTLNVVANDTDPNTGQALRAVSATGAGHGTVTVHDGVVRYEPAAGYLGQDTFEYVVTDDAGATDAATVTVTVDALPVGADDTATTAAGTAVLIPVLANDTDPEGQALTLVSVTAPGHGTAQVSGTSVRYTPAPGFAGTDTFTYVVGDVTNGTGTATVTVSVANAAPVAAADVAAVAAGSSIDLDVLANDTDANPGQALSVTTVSVPAHGTAVRTDEGLIRYTPAAGWAGTDEFTYSISDGEGGTATGTASVVTTSEEPVAVADSVTTPYQRAITVRVLANDIDPNDHDLTVTAVTQPAKGKVTYTAGAVRYTPPDDFSGTATFAYTVDNGFGQTATATVTVTVGRPPDVPNRTAVAEPGSPVTIALPTVDENQRPIEIVGVGQPSHGTVKLGADGKVVYTPDKGYVGRDSFSYTAQDADGNIATGYVEVNVAGPNRAPRAVDDNATVSVGRSVVVKALLNDRDPDRDRLRITLLGATRHGTAVLNDDGTVTYRPVEGYAGGADSFTYRISDGEGGSDTATVRVEVTAAEEPTTTVKLPTTGADVMSVVGAGVLALLVGVILYWATTVRMPGVVAPAGFAAPFGRGPGRHRPGRHRRRA